MAGQSAQLTRAESARLQNAAACKCGMSRGTGGKVEVKIQPGRKVMHGSAKG